MILSRIAGVQASACSEHAKRELSQISLATTGVVDNNLQPCFHTSLFSGPTRRTRSAADELLAGANQLLKNIPGVVQFHAGKMTPSHRPVVEQSYQVALNLIFAEQDRRRTIIRRIRSTSSSWKNTCKRLVKKVVVYDFE